MEAEEADEEVVEAEAEAAEEAEAKEAEAEEEAVKRLVRGARRGALALPS